MPKLTLSADRKVIDLAKKLAGQRGSSVSEMFSQLIRSMAEPGEVAAVPPRTRQASGLVRLPRGKGDRQLIEEALTRRYGT